MKIVDDDKDDIPEVQEDEFWKAPLGTPADWQPSLDQDPLPLELQVVKSRPNNWGEIRKVVQVEQEQGEEIKPGRISLAEIRDPGLNSTLSSVTNGKSLHD